MCPAMRKSGKKSGTEEEIVNNSSSPVFLLSGEKNESEWRS